MTFEEKQFYDYSKYIFKNSLAYKKFLSSKGVASLKKFPKKYEDLPFTDKLNYLEKYPIDQRIAKDRKLSSYYMICTSSGSTGEPTIWPRDYEQDKKAINFNYSIYKELFHVDKKRTLVVVTFGLGAWTAGMLTSRLCWEMPSESAVSVVTPGLDKEVALRVINKLSKYYDQTIITGYPPFIIDLVDHGISQQFDFKKINTIIHFTSARLLESQRSALAKIISKSWSTSDILGFYASSEAGIIGVETPDTISILDNAVKNQKFCDVLFNTKEPPSFVVYDPKIRFLEEKNGKLIISIKQAVPLLRYDTKDRGGIFDSRYLKNVCKRFGVEFPIGLDNKNFAYVYGRTDSVRLLSNIYTEDILYCISKSRISSKLTGNFKYGLKDAGLRNVLKVIIFIKTNEKINRKQQEYFLKDFYKNLSIINPDFKMVSAGINFNISIEFAQETDIKYKGGKFDYRL